jgi:hypothetical protein
MVPHVIMCGAEFPIADGQLTMSTTRLLYIPAKKDLE